MAKLSGKAAVVTGASKGIGAQVAKELASHGASVVVNYSTSQEGAQKVVDAITAAGGKAVAVGGNVARPKDIDQIFAEAKKAYGKVDILVNNAGIYSFTPIETLTEDQIDGMFNVNVKGLLLATKTALPLFTEEGGSIVNVGSVIGEMTPPQASVYAATKAALNSITRVLAKELGPKKIRVNAVNPGPIATEGFKAAGFADNPVEAHMVANTPLGRLGQPDDVATVVAFLASDDAKWVTGSLLDAAGGWR